MNPGDALPEVNADTEPWWLATRDRQLVLQRCQTCGHFQHYPRPLCLACRGTDLGFEPSAGLGTIYSFSIVHRSPDPGRWTAPYVVALVDLDEGPRLFTSIVGCDPADVRCDLQVTVGWRPLSDGRHLPVFAPLT